MSAQLVNFAKAIDPAVKVVFNGTFRRARSSYKEICSVRRPDDYTTEIGSNVGLSMARLRTEQQSVTFETHLEGDSKNLTQYEYDIGTKISKKLMKWNKLGQIKALVAQDSQAVARRREFDVTKLLERADATSYTHSVDGSTVIDLTGGGSLALQSTAHLTTKSSTSLSNQINDGTTQNMDLAEDALEAAETVTGPAITDHADQVIEFDWTRLFVSRKKRWTAMRLLKTAAGRVGTPNNDINLVQGRYKLSDLPYMDTARNEYWFLKDDMLNEKEGFMTYLEGQGIEADGPFVDFDTKAIKYSWGYEQASGHNNWHSYLVSQGDNT